MCFQDEPPHDPPRCERRLWREGKFRPCGQTVGVQTWRDGYGIEHAACHHHIGEVLYRFPEVVPTAGMTEREAVKAYDR